MNSSNAGSGDSHADLSLSEQFRWSDLAIWFVRRNPLYLLSAAAMAVAARLFLVDPDTRAGDVGHILLTLGVLQLYEMAVTAVVLILHRHRRSPEDRPSLLIVATIFWTAPLAATTELTAQHGAPGVTLALVAALLAVVEFESVRRFMALPICGLGRGAAIANLVLVSLLPAFLRRSDALASASEVALLAGWWLLAALVLVIAGAARSSSIRHRADSPPGRERAGLVEVAWLMLLATVSGVQLYGMNHAFFLHATPAYAAPAVVLLALVLIESRPLLRDSANAVRAGALLLPLAGMLLAQFGLDAKFVQPSDHWLVARPLAVTSVLAGLVWWIAWRRGCGALFLHLGSGAIAFGVAQLAFPAGAATTDLTVETSIGTDGRYRLAFAAFAAGAYFTMTAIARRSRVDGVCALASAAGGVFIAIWGLIAADRAIAAITLYWFWFLALHLALARPSLRQLALCVGFGLIATIMLDSHGPSRIWIWSHAPLIPLSLAGLWFVLRRREYVSLAGAAAAIPLAYLGISAGARIRPSPGTVAAVSAFALLLAGACLSWFKPAVPSGPREPTSPTDPTIA